MSSQIFYSTVRPELKITALRRGVFFGLLGVAIFLYMGTSLTSDEFNIWGLVGFILSGVLITLGLKPYRRLTALESCPHCLRSGHSGQIEFSYSGKPFIALNATDISDLTYRDVPDSYGIVVCIGNLDKLQKLNAGLDLNAYTASTRCRYGGDLFFPLFSQRSFEKLKTMVEPRT